MIVGLDVSTSFVGVAIIHDDPTIQPPNNIVLLDHIDFKGCATFLDKADRLRSALMDLGQRYPGVTKVVVEEAVQRYGFATSISTIGALIRFNGFATFFAYDSFSVRPRYITAQKARTACSIKLKSKKASGLTQKEQTFRIMTATDLSHVEWDRIEKGVRKGEVVPWAYDVVDAYVVAKSEHAGLSVLA